jgi:hypothetical protein
MKQWRSEKLGHWGSADVRAVKQLRLSHKGNETAGP